QPSDLGGLHVEALVLQQPDDVVDARVISACSVGTAAVIGVGNVSQLVQVRKDRVHLDLSRKVTGQVGRCGWWFRRARRYQRSNSQQAQCRPPHGPCRTCLVRSSRNGTPLRPPMSCEYNATTYAAPLPLIPSAVRSMCCNVSDGLW